jgi:hypothetical protein
MHCLYRCSMRGERASCIHGSARGLMKARVKKLNPAIHDEEGQLVFVFSHQRQSLSRLTHRG